VIDLEKQVGQIIRKRAENQIGLSFKLQVELLFDKKAALCTGGSKHGRHY
jgi:hypothetical protein